MFPQRNIGAGMGGANFNAAGSVTITNNTMTGKQIGMPHGIRTECNGIHTKTTEFLEATRDGLVTQLLG